MQLASHGVRSLEHNHFMSRSTPEDIDIDTVIQISLAFFVLPMRALRLGLLLHLEQIDSKLSPSVARCQHNVPPTRKTLASVPP